MRGTHLFDYGALIIGFCVVAFFVMILVTATELALARQPSPHPVPHIRPAASTSVATAAPTCART